MLSIEKKCVVTVRSMMQGGWSSQSVRSAVAWNAGEVRSGKDRGEKKEL